MRRAVLAVFAVLVFSSAARAALVLHVPDMNVTPGSSGSFDVWVEETSGTQAALQGASVGLKQSASGTTTFTGFGAPSGTHPNLFTSPTYTNGTASASGYVAGRDLAMNADSGSEVGVQNGVRDGLFGVSYSVAALAVPGTVITINIDPANTLLSDALGNEIAYVADPGSFTVVAAPEPASLGLALLGLPLLMRRRK